MRFQLKGVYLSLSVQARRHKKALQRIGLVIGGLAVGLFVSLLGVSQAVSQVEATSFSFTKVVDTDTPVPGFNENFKSFSDPSLDNGNIAFIGGRYVSATNINNFYYRGIYTNVDGSLNVVADTNTPIPRGGGKFIFFYDFSLNNGSVAFAATREIYDYTPGIYTNVSGSLNVVADLNTPIPSGTGGFIVSEQPSLNNGSVAFFGQGYTFPLQQGIYKNNGGVLSVVADLNTPIPGGTGNLGGFSQPSLNNESVAFIGSGNSQRGIYTNNDGVLSVVADTNTPIPGGTGNFDNFNNPSLSNGSVAFVGYKDSQQGIYTNNNNLLSVIADTNTPIPSGTGNFTSFFNCSSNFLNRCSTLSLNNGNIAFKGTGTADFQGIYTTLGGVLTKVIDTNDSLDGLAISSLSFGREGLSGNQIAFDAVFSDGSQAIYIATLDPTSIPESSN